MFKKLTITVLVALAVAVPLGGIVLGDRTVTQAGIMLMDEAEHQAGIVMGDNTERQAGIMLGDRSGILLTDGVLISN